MTDCILAIRSALVQKIFSVKAAVVNSVLKLKRKTSVSHAIYFNIYLKIFLILH